MRPVILCMALMLGGLASADENMTGARQLHMANCPSAVDGAVTRMVELEDGVQLTVTARSEWAGAEIRRRARTLAAASWEPERGAIEHTGLGTGTGRFGYCPGVLEGTTVDAELQPDGARITVRAEGAARVQELKRLTRIRLRALTRERKPIGEASGASRVANREAVPSGWPGSVG